MEYHQNIAFVEKGFANFIAIYTRTINPYVMVIESSCAFHEQIPTTFQSVIPF